MRRAEREITDINEILGIIDSCDVCRLGLCDGGTPYVVPLNFGYQYEGGQLTLYFHGAHEGKKMDVIAKNPAACFEMDAGHRLVSGGDTACRYSMEFKSVVGTGCVEVCRDAAEKEGGLKLLMRQYARDKSFSFTDAQIRSVAVLRLKVDTFTGKCYQK